MVRIGRWILWTGTVLAVLLYPMLISIYVTLPLFIGYAGWLIIRGLDGAGWRYLMLPALYLVNLEINLSLPLFLTMAAVLATYLFLAPLLGYFRRCRFCVTLFSVAMIDLIYLGMLMVYDFIFASGSVEINTLLFYSLGMDLLAAVIL